MQSPEKINVLARFLRPTVLSRRRRGDWRDCGGYLSRLSLFFSWVAFLPERYFFLIKKNYQFENILFLFIFKKYILKKTASLAPNKYVLQKKTWFEKYSKFEASSLQIPYFHCQIPYSRGHFRLYFGEHTLYFGGQTLYFGDQIIHVDVIVSVQSVPLPRYVSPEQ